MEKPFITRAALSADLVALGVAPGDAVMVHGAMRKVGRLLNGPDALVGALLDTIGAEGTIVAYTDWDACYHELVDADGRVPEEWRAHVPPFDPLRSRAARDNGALAEFIRTTPGAVRSRNPDASFAALGRLAGWITADQPYDYGYGEGSPLAKLVEAGGKVLMVGAPLDTMTLLHHAEHLADLPDKRLRRYEVPLATAEGVIWRDVEEFENTDPVSPALPDDHFDRIVTAFLEAGQGRRGRVGEAPSVLVEAPAMVAFAIDWMEKTAGRK